MSADRSHYMPPPYVETQPGFYSNEESYLASAPPIPEYQEFTYQGQEAHDGMEHVYIAVMGSTGAGKSSFIELCTGQDVGVGHNLQSCTTDVEEYEFTYRNKFHVHLVDTSGFDDTNRSDAEVLRDVATWLGTAYKQDVRLSGIIYLHRISDVRMTGTARRNLQMFKKLCGEECFPKIVLATTFWGTVDPRLGAAREQELIETEGFWGFMTKKGSCVMRHLGDHPSAMNILEHIFAQSPAQKAVPLAIQREIVDEGVKLDDTAAGRSIDEELRKQRDRYEREIRFMQAEKEEALRNKDLESYEETRKVQQEYEEKIAKSLRDSESLKVDLETIQLDMARKIKQLQDELNQKREEMAREAQQGNRRPVRERQTELQEFEAKQEEVKRQKKGIFGKLSSWYDQTNSWVDKNPAAAKRMLKVGKFAMKVGVHALTKSA